MDQINKNKIRNIISKYRNKSSIDLSKDISYDSKQNNTINTSREKNIQDQRRMLNLIKEESE